jgi:hypothetical protein
MTAISSGIRRRARRLSLSYEFLFMRANGDQAGHPWVGVAEAPDGSTPQCDSLRLGLVVR